MTEISAVELAEFQRGMTDAQKMMFQTQFNGVRKDRTTGLILSVLFGTAGIDRFYVGDTGIGLLKLFTAGLCGILYIADWFSIGNKVDDYNRLKAQEIAAALRITEGS